MLQIILLPFLFCQSLYGYRFESVLLNNSPDNNTYFILSSDFDNDERLDILSGSVNGDIYLHHNSINGWNKILIQNLVGSVHAEVFDVNEDGFPDIIVAHKFGGCPDNCRVDDGLLAWLENPKGNLKSVWIRHSNSFCEFNHKIWVSQ